MVKKIASWIGSMEYTGGQSIETIIADYLAKPRNWEQGVLADYR